MIGHSTHPELGAWVADHPPNYAYTARRVLLGLLLAAAGVTVALIGIKVIPLPIREGFWETASALAMGGILLASGLFLAGDGLWTTGPRVTVYERGFVAGRDVYPWDRVEAFHQLGVVLTAAGLPFSLTEYTVRRDDRRTIRFTLGVCRSSDLAAVIQARINPRLLEEARAAFAAGREVDFGVVQVTTTGLRYSDVVSGQTRDVSWDQVRRVEGGGMQIRVRRVDESWLARLSGADDGIATRKVANAEVFLSLVAEILGR